MNEIARELWPLMQTIQDGLLWLNTWKSRRNSDVHPLTNYRLIGQRMDELASQMTTLTMDNPQRAKVVKEIESLSELLKVVNG